MKKIKTNRKGRLFLIIVLIILLVPFGLSFALYASQKIQYHTNKSSTFFFTSDILDGSSDKVELFAQDGKTFSFYLYNYDYDKNNTVYITDKNLTYTVAVSGLNTVTLSSTSGTLTATSGVKRSAKIDVTIPSSYTDGVEFTITANATAPYRKTLSKTFVLHKKKSGNSYIIKDTVGSNYATLTIKTLGSIAKDALTLDWTASGSKGIDLDTTNKYLINSDYSIPSSITSKVSTNKQFIEAESQIDIIIFKQDKSEYFGTGVEQTISSNRINITKRN